jgi:hypothetical protein
MLIFKLSISPAPFKEQTKLVVVLVIIPQGKMELREVSYAEIPYEDGFFDRACAVNCIYFWPDSVADLKDNLSDI